MTALVLALCAALGYAHVPPLLAAAIASAATTPEDAALVVVYGAHESGLSEHPRAWAWDAMAGVSCGLLQLRCSLVRSLTVEGQVREWLRLVHSAGLAAVDSSPTRAAQRRAEAEALLARLR